MDRRTRICLWVIILGLANFVAFTIGYVFIGGDAMMGDVHVLLSGESGRAVQYRIGASGAYTPVPPGVWVYSALHSISIWPTFGAIMLAMLTLAKDRIVDSMRSAVVRGRTLITILATVITLISIVLTVWFLLHMIRNLSSPAVVQASLGGPLP